MSEIAEDCNGRPLISRGFWFRLVAAALAVRVFVVFVLLHSEPLVSDARAYTRQARELVHHFPGGAYYWPPGQSYLLASVFAVVGDSDAVAKATNIAVDVANVVLAVLLARRLLTDARAIRLTGWLLALFPSTVLLAGEPYSLSLTMFCLLGAALLLLRGDERNRWLEFAGAGALIGFGVLTRPSVVTVVAALVVVMGVLVWRRSRRSPARVRPLVARSAAFVAVLALVVVPVLHHNADHGQGWTVSTANEQNFWFGNNPYTPTYKTWELGQRAPTDPKARQYLERFGFHLGYYRSSSPSRAQRRAMLHEATRFIVHHPAITALRTLDRAQAFWGFDYTSSNDLRDTLGLTRAEHLPLVALEAGGWFIVALLAVVGLTSARYLIRTPIALFMLALVLGYALAYLAAYASGRWHEPVLGFVVPFAAAGAVWLMDTPGVTRRLRRNPAFLTLAFVFVIVQLVYAYAVATSI